MALAELRKNNFLLVFAQIGLKPEVDYLPGFG